MPKRIGALISAASFAVASLAFVSVAWIATVPEAAAQSARSANGSFAVNDFVLGAKVPADGAQVRDYRCGPSEQFDGFTWCQRSRQDRDRRITSSLLHANDGKIAYLNRQEPSSLDGRQIEEEIRSYTRRLGSQPRISRLPRRAGGPEGVLAMWGQVDIEPLDAESISVLADGRSPRKGFLIDYLGNLTRSAQDGLPVFRITGGPGFIWVASYDVRGRGTLRITAVDTSALSPPVAATPVPPSVVADAHESNPPFEPSTESSTAPGPITLADAKVGVADADSASDSARMNSPADVQAVAAAAPPLAATRDTAPISANERAAADAEIARLRFAVGVAYSLIGGLLLLLTAVFIRLLIEKRRRRLDRQAGGAASYAPAPAGTARAPAQGRPSPQGSPQAVPQTAKATVPPAAAAVALARDAPVEQARTAAAPNHALSPAPIAAPVPPAAAPLPTASIPVPAAASVAPTSSTAPTSAPTPAPAPSVPAGVSEPMVQTASLSIVPEDALEQHDAPAVARTLEDDAKDDSIHRLAELSKLRATGMLTDDEFNQLKSAIIASVAGSQPAAP